MINDLLLMLFGLLLVFLVGCFIWAATELFGCVIEANRLLGGAQKLENGASPEEAFPGRTSIQQHAAAVARKVKEPKLTLHFHPDRQLVAFTAEFSARLSRPRALAGLLIIFGLLITLTNLKRAVEEMKVALEPPSLQSTEIAQGGQQVGSESATSGSKIQRGIEGIATSAGTAFGYSAIAIFSAAIILGVSIGAQRRVNSAIGRFVGWVYEQHDVFLLKQFEQPQNTSEKLSYAAESLARVATNFEDTNAALAELKVLGGKVESASKDISEAVGALPTQIDTSMTKISGDVADGIRAGLEHQSEYLKSLVAIYSDHAVTLKKTIEFISRLTDTQKGASDALVQLRSLPEEIRALVTSTAQVRTAAQQLTSSVQSLDQKVTILPADELTVAAKELADAAARFTKFEPDVAGVLETVKALVQSAVDEATKRNSEAMVQQLEKLKSIVQSVKSDVMADAGKQSADLQATLAQIRLVADRLATSDGSADIKALRHRLEQVMQNVAPRPSFQVIRLL